MSNQFSFCKIPEKTPWSKPKNKNAARQHAPIAARNDRPRPYQSLIFEGKRKMDQGSLECGVFCLMSMHTKSLGVATHQMDLYDVIYKGRVKEGR
jgi:hypothetical protein